MNRKQARALMIHKHLFSEKDIKEAEVLLDNVKRKTRNVLIFLTILTSLIIGVVVLVNF